MDERQDHFARLAATLRRQEDFGHVRPAVHAEFQGGRVVCVGNEVLFSDKWRTFPDFLQYYIKRVLTPTWGNKEIAKPFDERHPVMQWYDCMCRFEQKQPKGTDGLFVFFPNGPTHAYLLLAYDLYTLRHHMALQSCLVDRLKHRDQFQGARHELFASATCIRAGFDVEYEDETDGFQKHSEFVGTHRGTGQKIAVEAKSRHRDGVLGRKGQMEPVERIRPGIRRLLNDALKKPATHPYVIFMDLNLPPFDGKLVD